MDSPAFSTSAVRPFPHLIAIAGPSCAGKTSLAQGLVAALPNAVHFPLDAYYLDRSHLPPSQRADCNFDAPTALDYELLYAHVRALSQGDPVDVPTYNFHSHCRGSVTHRINPPTYLLVEGLFALYFPPLLPLYSYRIYVDVDADICLQRRIIRDVEQRGRTPEDIREQFTQHVAPMAERYLHPTRRRADCIVQGTDDLSDLVSRIANVCKTIKIRP